ncbi:hypothetical protein JCM15548_11521 [Geofilum rubicundum JCM 15548]|uniref:Stress-response A/B barrel domain-containing protein n=1 Tax=Geofilum rubicundum JCM 15548 TaxID=1236989 RepID=A0A0E9LW35_9BACT|nr:hypothetical protein JCM15548_11521 [Geofilum rubicundum JCM 15548]
MKNAPSDVLVHHVYFWLHEPDSPDAREQMQRALEELSTIETIRYAHLGVPAATESRDVVDHSYTYSLMLFFDSKEDQDSYQIDSQHLQFVEENQHLWERVIVYDSVKW